MVHHTLHSYENLHHQVGSMMKINTGNITMGVPGTILIEEPILIREVILNKNVILMVAGIPVVL